MSSITSLDGTEIFYKDWEKGQPIVFSHGWPPSAGDWDTQMLFFPSHGYRVMPMIGAATAARATSPTAHLDSKNVIRVGHSTGRRQGRALHCSPQRKPRSCGMPMRDHCRQSS
jgi:non-heme chloroperoxidase